MHKDNMLTTQKQPAGVWRKAFFWKALSCHAEAFARSLNESHAGRALLPVNLLSLLRDHSAAPADQRCYDWASVTVFS